MNADILLNGLLALAAITVLVSLWNLHRRNGRYSNFNLVYLIVNKDGFPDGAKCIEIGAFLLLSWGFIVYMTSATKSLPEWYLITYTGAFIARAGYGAYLRSKGEPPEVPGTTTKTDSVTKVTTTEVTPDLQR